MTPLASTSFILFSVLFLRGQVAGGNALDRPAIPGNLASLIALHVVRATSSEDWYDDLYEHAVGILEANPTAQMTAKERREAHDKMLVEIRRLDEQRTMFVSIQSVQGRATSGARLDFEFHHDDGQPPRVLVTGTWHYDRGPKSGVLEDIQGDVYVNQENVLANTLAVRFALRAGDQGSPTVLMGAFRVTE